MLHTLICILFDHKYRLRDDRTVFQTAKISYCGRCREFFSIEEIRYKNRTIPDRALYFAESMGIANWLCLFTGHEYTLRNEKLICIQCDCVFNDQDHNRLEQGFDCFAWRLRRLRERKNK